MFNAPPDARQTGAFSRRKAPVGLSGPATLGSPVPAGGLMGVLAAILGSFGGNRRPMAQPVTMAKAPMAAPQAAPVRSMASAVMPPMSVGGPKRGPKMCIGGT